MMTRRTIVLITLAVVATIAVMVSLLIDRTAPGPILAPPVEPEAPVEDSASVPSTIPTTTHRASPPTEPAVEPEPESQVLAGVVIDRATRASVPGCRLRIADRALRSVLADARTAENGRFAIALGRPPQDESVASAWIIASHAQYRPASLALRAARRSPGKPLVIELDPPLRISGKVVRADGQAVTNARVVIERHEWFASPEPGWSGTDLWTDLGPRGSYECNSDAGGDFQVSPVAPGRYAVSVTAPGLLRRTTGDGVLAVKPVITVPPSVEELTFVMEAYRQVAIRPVDRRTLAPIGTATVEYQSGRLSMVQHDGARLREMFRAEDVATIKAQGILVGIVPEGEASSPLRVAVSAAGFQDAVIRVSSAPVSLGGTTRLTVTDLPMEPSPGREPLRLTLVLDGPPWIEDLRSLPLQIRERPSALNPSPNVLPRVVTVPVRGGRGTIDLLVGEYSLDVWGNCRWFEPIPLIKVESGTENVLHLPINNALTAVRVQGVAPDGTRVPVLLASARNAAGEVQGQATADDPLHAWLLVDLRSETDVRLSAAGLPCREGRLRLDAAPGAAGLWRDLEVPLEWEF